jgi:hypothetical protein
MICAAARLGGEAVNDWGDAVIAHPFAAMLVPLTWTQRRLAVSFNAPDLARIRDAYLHVFSDLGPTRAPSVRSLTAQIHCLSSGRGHPVGEVQLRYRRADGGFADIAPEHVWWLTTWWPGCRFVSIGTW